MTSSIAAESNSVSFNTETRVTLSISSDSESSVTTVFTETTVSIFTIVTAIAAVTTTAAATTTSSSPFNQSCHADNCLRALEHCTALEFCSSWLVTPATSGPDATIPTWLPGCDFAPDAAQHVSSGCSCYLKLGTATATASY